MAAAQKFAPPPVHWAAGQQPVAGRQPGAGQLPVTGAAMQRKATTIPPVHWPGARTAVQPPVTTVAQPMRAFSANARAGFQHKASAGDELVGMGGDFQLRSHANQVLSRPSGIYNFVRVQGQTRNQATTFMASNSPHAALAAERPVLYAGTAAFRDGALQWWSNYSGTYQPQAAFSRQAALPEEKFVPWQKLQMGGVGLQRGMLADKRTAATPDAKKFLTASKASPDRPSEKTSEAPRPAPVSARPATPAPKQISGSKDK